MKEFDEQEKRIIRELIRNPKTSDNQIGRHTGIPVKTVNRKRKLLEQEGILNYLTFVNHGSSGTRMFHAQYIYLIRLRFGITIKQVRDRSLDFMSNRALSKHVSFSSAAEEDGHIVLIIVLESYKDDDIIEIFNAELMPLLGNFFGADAVSDVRSMPVRADMRIFHNYMLGLNTENGVLKKDWPSENIFIS